MLSALGRRAPRMPAACRTYKRALKTSLTLHCCNATCQSACSETRLLSPTELLPLHIPTVFDPTLIQLFFKLDCLSRHHINLPPWLRTILATIDDRVHRCKRILLLLGLKKPPKMGPMLAKRQGYDPDDCNSSSTNRNDGWWWCSPVSA